mmetsp:Transcript_100383/g.304574  ORF Transcript_100383/g.304574 Transcript_100383/m.304574 type:complete len:789 (-) Transcript_100383:294-2660(-)
MLYAGGEGLCCTVGEVPREAFCSACKKSPSMVEWLNAIQKLGRLCALDGSLLSSFELFHGLSDNTLQDMSHCTCGRVFFPSEEIMREGEAGTEFYVLVHGRVSMEMAGRVVRTFDRAESKGHVFLGELGLLGLEQLRSATVTAQSLCLVRVLHRPVFLQKLQEHSESMHLQGVSDLLRSRGQGGEGCALTKQKLHDVGIFKDAGCSEAFLDFLAQHLEERVFLTDQTIVEESTEDRCMYILSHGAAKVVERGRVLAELSSGAVIGEMSLLGVVAQQTATVVATEICCAEVLHPSIVLRGLELFAEERPRVFAAAHASSCGIGVPPTDMDQAFRRSLIAEVMRAPFFEGMSLEFVEQLSALSMDRIFMPGELIIEEGKKGNSMFIVISGEALVFVNRIQGSRFVAGSRFALGDEGEEGPILELKPFNRADAHNVNRLSVGSVFGELAMLGIAPTRSATVQAESLCSLWEIRQDKVLQFVTDIPSLRKKFVSIISLHLEPTVSWRLQSLPLFKEFDQQFRMLLGLSCKRRVFFPGQTIVREGQRGLGVLIVNIGEARYEHQHTLVSTYRPGGYLGCDIMLGIQKLHSGTLTATEVCHILVVTRESYQIALQKYPSPTSADALLETAARESEAFHSAMKRLRLKLFVMQRCAADLQSPQEPQGIHVGMLQSELTARTFQAWLAYAREQSHQRRQYRWRRDKVDQWISRFAGARKQRLLEAQLAVQQQEKFSWVTSVAWDSSTVPTGKRPRQPALPRVAPISGLSVRSLDLSHRASPALPTPRTPKLPSISA